MGPSRMFRSILRPPLAIGIRTQLTALVCFVACVSLIILAVPTGIYFTVNYKHMRVDRLSIAAELKSSQVDQTLNFLYYQCYWLSIRDTLQTAMANYFAGNKSSSVWYDSQVVVEKFLSSSDIFSISRLYDANFNLVMNATNNGTGNVVPNDVLAKLLPLSSSDPLPASLGSSGMLTDPVLNSTTYLMSMSLPILANPSIILTDSKVYGYITIIMSAESLMSVYNDTTALEKSNVAIVSGEYSDYSASLTEYHFVFPPYGATPKIIDIYYPLQNGSFLYDAMNNQKKGSIMKTKFFYNNDVAIGYSPCSFDLVSWVAIVSQPESVFLSPSTKLTRIIAGTVVAIAVFVCFVTFPLSHWAVKPIVRLQKATELIAEGRGLRSSSNRTLSRNGSLKFGRYSIDSPIIPISPTFLHNNNNHHRNSSNESHDPEKLSHLSNDISKSSNSSSTGSRFHFVCIFFSSHKSSNTPPPPMSTILETKVPVYRRLFLDELSELTDTFNTMSDALDQHYALLEERVRARTKQLEAAKIEAEAANEAKTVFIANISHELRTPLNGILGMTAISMEEDDIDNIKSSLKLIFRSGELLLHILTELLTFSKNVLQRTKLEERDFCITDVALQIKSIFGKVAKDQHVKLSIYLIPNEIRTLVLWGDSNRIIQIVMNLVSNALKFTPIDGKVSVRMSLLGEYDKEKSKAADYKEVFVKTGTEPEENYSKILQKLNTEKLIATRSARSCDNEERHNELIGEKNDIISNNHQSSNTTFDISIHNRTRDDTLSLLSTSTSSYDETVFNDQFKKITGLQDHDEERLGVEIKEPKTWVICIEVEDTGPGIHPALQESVFEPFVQGDQALSRQYGGTGLGLSICRQLATMMNGTMVLESKVGSGSKFTFTVPLTQTREIVIGEDEDINEFFDDEFNIYSKKNRKVKFAIPSSPGTTLANSSLKSRKSKGSLNSSFVGEIQNVNEAEEDAYNSKDINSSGELKIRHISTSTSNNNSIPSLDRPFLQSTGTATSTMKIPVLKDFSNSATKDNVTNDEGKSDLSKKGNSGGTIIQEGVTQNNSSIIIDEEEEDEGIRILVTEDNHVNQEVIKRMLKLEKLSNIDLACDGEEAYTKVKEITSISNPKKKNYYDLIFMDVQMPRMDGLESTKLIRSELKYTKPIVALTAFADESNIKECLDVGMDGFLSKPIKRPKLKDILNEFCPGYHLQNNTDTNKGLQK
ncbi:hypothetical protein TBLA_0I01680 [Henningerozyma blattae CBS 6284]|uniref:histidine kinase n=1 Tax=Henningerozyma blattae (strain ATCC 34711 / CBS 6284 / DSM 70876 / NBRC 10599 / NRRL Y-10934 / UCD 77-7) TaxID=1071380 RepID=I2H8X4_HENB6|nr:hypothetical protein TBLA_0I01680 [Tetrapisispora blattae CBS 6284]CCH62826.1 hypothetical protein TBLA_0I01680 [Tetrapisispora blattae CBS 6284]